MNFEALGPGGTIAVIAFAALLALYAYGAWVRPRAMSVDAELDRTYGTKYDFALTVRLKGKGELKDLYVRGDRCYLSDGDSYPSRSMKLPLSVYEGESFTIYGRYDQGQEARAKVEVKWTVDKEGRTWLNGRRYFLGYGRVQNLDPHVVQSKLVQPDRWVNDNRAKLKITG